MTSKIKVDNIENQCGGAVVTKCGATTTISGSVVKADDIQAADGGNLINQCGTTITLGASGDTINLASGATQSGFGRTGTVDWDTTAKTASFTAVNGNGYFVNTTSGAITVTLPTSPSAGNVVAVSDYNSTAATNNITIARNSSNINGTANDLLITKANSAVQLVYVDATTGWQSVTTANTDDVSNPNLTAIGGTITSCGDYKIHTFTGPGTFTVTNESFTPANNIVSYMVVAGGGAGAKGCRTGGGGAGGFREYKGPADCYTASPLNGNPGGTAITVTAQAYPITVGGGGPSPTSGPFAAGGDGSPSVFSTVISTGGGGGGGPNSSPGSQAGAGRPGGSGGGGAHFNQNGGSGNTPPVSPSQGFDGGDGQTGGNAGSGGGGGAGAVGGDGCASPPGQGGPGGAGVTTNITGSPVTRAGGGGGAGDAGAKPGGSGGGGAAGNPGTAGTTNTGSGGGGGISAPGAQGGNGGSGIVIIRYRFQ